MVNFLLVQGHSLGCLADGLVAAAVALAVAATSTALVVTAATVRVDVSRFGQTSADSVFLPAYNLRWQSGNVLLARYPSHGSRAVAPQTITWECASSALAVQWFLRRCTPYSNEHYLTGFGPVCFAVLHRMLCATRAGVSVLLHDLLHGCFAKS